MMVGPSHKITDVGAIQAINEYLGGGQKPKQILKSDEWRVIA